MLTSAQRETMAAHQAKVGAILERAEEELSGWVSSWFRSDAQQQVEGAARQARTLWLKWVDEASTEGRRRWAEAGVTPDGRRYALIEWMKLGDEIGQLAAYAAQVHFQSGAWAIAEGTAGGIAADLSAGGAAIADGADRLRKITNDLAKPWTVGTKVVVGATAGLLGVAAVVAARKYLRTISRGLL